MPTERIMKLCGTLWHRIINPIKQNFFYTDAHTAPCRRGSSPVCFTGCYLCGAALLTTARYSLYMVCCDFWILKSTHSFVMLSHHFHDTNPPARRHRSSAAAVMRFRLEFQLLIFLIILFEFCVEQEAIQDARTLPLSLNCICWHLNLHDQCRQTLEWSYLYVFNINQ
jgi:hypothetical protein